MNTKQGDTIRRRNFGNLRSEMKNIVISISRDPNGANPDFWNDKSLQIIKNKARVPQKYLPPLLAITNDAIRQLPAGLGIEYLRPIHCSAIRLKENGGRKGWLYRSHFGERIMLLETKMSKEAELEGRFLRPAQLRLPFEVRPASQIVLKRA